MPSSSEETGQEIMAKLSHEVTIDQFLDRKPAKLKHRDYVEFVKAQRAARALFIVKGEK